MEKKSRVRLTDEARDTLRGMIPKLQGASQHVRRAHMLFKADAHGPHWTDKKIADAFAGRTNTVENVRQRLVTGGCEIALHGEKPQTPPRPKRLDGEQEAQVIAWRLGKPPKGFATWSVR
jgi:cytochrome c551/c552